ncbi:ABC transporter substrate-binding protein [Nocardioides sp. LML1-1-1.1]|uniref:ABC transporter substrate-binding protein n=1 Tax=Nocardioides sp. LML1-1-1.1 TaxID=3135248 RepID=UPI00342357F6
MNHRTTLALSSTLVAALVGGLAAGCGSGVADDSTPAAASGAYPVTVESCGTKLTVDHAPRRVVGLMPSQTELLVRLGLADRLVGQAQTATHDLPADVAAKVSGVPVLSTTTPPAREDLLAVAPDVVVSPTMYEFTAEQGFATLDQLRAAGAVGYVAAGGCPDRRTTATVDDLFTDITALGTVFDAADEAEALAEEGRSRLAAVAKAIDGKERPSVAQLYVEGSSVSAIGAGVEHDIIRVAGGDNLFSPDEPLFDDFFAAVVSPEEVAARNPDAIVFGVTGPAHEKQVRAYLERTFPRVTAVAEDRLVAVPASDMYPGTLGNISAVERIAAALYPDSF